MEIQKKNEIAYEAIEAASNNPGKVYNPLVLCCQGSNKGKLARAKASINSSIPNARSLYINGEGNVDDREQRLATDPTEIDVLLVHAVDLIQEQEHIAALFELIDAMHSSSRQVVMTTANPLKEDLETRLRCYEGGLIV